MLNLFILGNQNHLWKFRFPQKEISLKSVQELLFKTLESDDVDEDTMRELLTIEEISKELLTDNIKNQLNISIKNENLIGKIAGSTISPSKRMCTSL